MTAHRDYQPTGPHPVRRPNHVGPSHSHPWQHALLSQSSRVADQGTREARARAGLADEMSVLADRVAEDERGGPPDPPINFEMLSRLARIRMRRELAEEND